MIGFGLVSAAILLLWAGSTGRSPAAVMTAILTGKPVPAPSKGAFVNRMAAPVQAPTQNATSNSGGGSGVIGFARQQLGEPYRWGGDGPDSWDCSGLTKAAYATVGKVLPRTAATQAAAVIRVSREEAVPGDLVFWGIPAYHVGIYLGGGRVLHAPQTGDVVKESALWGNPYFGRVR